MIENWGMKQVKFLKSFFGKIKELLAFLYCFLKTISGPLPDASPLVAMIIRVQKDDYNWRRYGRL